MIIYTIGFTGKHADQFFEAIKQKNIKLLIDIRLHNKTQLAGFTKGGEHDLGYLLKEICNCGYEHRKEYAPTKKILDDYKKDKITWAEYEVKYNFLMDEREAVKDFVTCYNGVYDAVCLLCAEPTPEHCHRRLLAEKIAEKLGDAEIIHL